MSKKEEPRHCKICNYQLGERDFDDTCIDCAVFYQGGLLDTYKKNKEDRSPIEKVEGCAGFRLLAQLLRRFRGEV